MIFTPPTDASAPRGEWLALVSARRCRRVHLPSGRTDDLAVEVGSLQRVQVTDAGLVFPSGFVYPRHATFAVGPDGRLDRVSPELSGVVDPEGLFLLETEHNGVRLRDLAQREEQGLAQVVSEVHEAVLGMAKTGHAVFGRPGEVVLLTDDYSVAGIALRTPHPVGINR